MTSKEIEELAGHRQVSAWVVKLVGDALAIERESIANICENMEEFGEDYDSYYGEKYAAIIRARGNNDV